MGSNKAGHDLKRLLGPWSIAGMVLVLLTLFGGLVEAGVVVPNFTSPGTGSDGNTYLNTVENSSWRSWTITAVRLAGGQKSRKLADGSTVRLGDLYPGEAPLGNSPPIGAMPLELRAGRSVTLTLVRSHVPKCKGPPLQTAAEIERLEAVVKSEMVEVPVEVSVTTLLGTRNVPIDFNLSDGCP